MSVNGRVKSCPGGPEVRLPLFTRKQRTQLGHRAMSEMCSHERTCPLFDHLVSLRKKRRRNRHAEGFYRLQIDHELELGGLNDRQICRLGAFENPTGVDANLMIRIRNARSVA